MKSKLVMKIEGGACSDVIAWNLELVEGLGEPYRAVVTTASEKVRTPADLKAQALGKRVVVTIEQYFENGLVKRHLDGIVTAVCHEGPASMRPEWLAQFSSEKPKGSLYSFVIEPTLVGLKQARRTQDYSDTTPLKTIQAVLGRHNISAIVDGAHVDAEAYSGKVRFVQDDETDWDFLHRILARYGLSYAFAHDEQGPEKLYLSDGKSFPSCCALGFENLDGYADGETLNFSCVKQQSGSFPMKRFAAAGAIGVDYVRERFLRPMKSVALEKEFGDSGSVRSWLLSDAPAGYCEHADDKSIEDDFQRATEALKVRLALARDAWQGETASVAAMPGKVIALTGFLDASGDSDTTLKAKIVRSRLAVRLGEGEKGNFAATFDAMDFSDDAERRWVLPAQPMRPSAGRRVFEAVVCDRNGDWSETQAKNTIVISPRSTPETPWIFLVANPNGDKGAVMDVAMTMPLGGKRQGLYRFPRVGERILVEDLGDRLVLAGYVPDRTTSPGDFPEDGDKWARSSATLRYAPPTGERAPDGDYDEIGFSNVDSPVAMLEQRIVDGTCIAYLQELSLLANDQRCYNTVYSRAAPRIRAARTRYFAEPGKASAQAVRDLARELVEGFRLESDPSAGGLTLRMRTAGSIVAFAENGISLTTPGELRINAGSVSINGNNAVVLESEGKVQCASGASSATINGNGIVARSRRVIGASGEYDSQVEIGASSGVTVTGANVRMNGLFSASMNDAMGGNVTTESGETMIAGAVVDLATQKRSTVTEAFKQLAERSGLNSINKTLEAWKAGKTPDGKRRPIADLGVGICGLSEMSGKAGALPTGNFRGTASGVSITGASATDANGWAGGDAEFTSDAYRQFGGADQDLTITQRELLRAKTFSEQMKNHADSLKGVLNTVVDGKSTSVTIHGHQLDLNAQLLKDLSERKTSDAANGSGAE